MSLKEKVLKVLEIGYQEQLAFLDRLSDEERAAASAPDHWNAKDALAHCLAWTGDLMSRFEAIRQNRPLPPQLEGDTDQKNLLLYEAHKADSWETVRQNAADLYQRTVRYVQDSSEEDLMDRTKMPPGPASLLPWRWLIGSSVTHTLLHLAEHDAKHRRQEHATHIQESLAAQLVDMDDDPAWRGPTIYNLGCFYACSGQQEKAITNILEGLALRPDLIEWSKQDPDLDSVRDDPRLQAVYARQ